MVVFVILGLSLLGLLIDRYIYVYGIRDTRCPRWLKITFNVLSLVVNIGTFIIMLFFNRIISRFGTDGSVMLLWVVYIFLLNLQLRLVFVFFSLIRKFLGAIVKRRLMIIEYIGWAVAIAIFFAMIWGSVVTRNVLRVETVTIESPNLPQSFDGYRIVLFSDTHIGNLNRNSTLIHRMVERINDLHPDIIIHGGDIVHIRHEELNGKYMREFSGLRAPDGIFAVLGNHDTGIYVVDTTNFSPDENTGILIEKQRQMGWTVLMNEHRWIHRGNDSIVIAGVKYPAKPKKYSRFRFTGSNIRAAFEGISDSDFSILVSHSPDVFDSIPELANPDLSIAGHIHAMQIKISIGPWRWSPSALVYPVWSGLYRRGNNYFYINEGIGHVAFPMRIGTKPEITLLELRRRK